MREISGKGSQKHYSNSLFFSRSSQNSLPSFLYVNFEPELKEVKNV